MYRMIFSFHPVFLLSGSSSPPSQESCWSIKSLCSSAVSSNLFGDVRTNTRGWGFAVLTGTFLARLGHVRCQRWCRSLVCGFGSLFVPIFAERQAFANPPQAPDSQWDCAQFDAPENVLPAWNGNAWMTCCIFLQNEGDWLFDHFPQVTLQCPLGCRMWRCRWWSWQFYAQLRAMCWQGHQVRSRGFLEGFLEGFFLEFWSCDKGLWIHHKSP